MPLINPRNTVEVCNLYKNFGSIHALSDVSFQLNQGDILGFLGPNGAGKTTTLRILSTFLAPSKGTVRVGGYNVRSHPLDVRRLIGYLPENAPLYPHMTVDEFLSFAVKIRKVPRQQRAQSMDRVLDTCGLTSVVNREIHTLSKGYRQRTGLAYALVHSPDILILDEPTSGLDPNQRKEFRKLIKSIGKERTVILSTHNLAEIQTTATRVIILSDGKVASDAPLSSIQPNPDTESFKVSLSAPEHKTESIAQSLEQIEGIVAVEAVPNNISDEISFLLFTQNTGFRKKLMELCVKENWPIVELSKHQQNLEHYFKYHTHSQTPKPTPLK